MPTDTLVELLDVNGEWWDLTEGDKGVYLATAVEGLFDPPVKAVYEEPGNYPGSRYLSHRTLRRDLVFGVWIMADNGESWLSRDSEWRKAWAFDRDCQLYITTPESGTRYLKVRLFESPEVETETDPRGETIKKCAMVTIAGDPFWYEDDVVYEAFTETDTRFDPNPLPWPWPQHAMPTETILIEVDPADGKGGLNPTDQPLFPKWVLPGSEEEPAEPYIPWLPWLGAPNSPATIWTVPDYSFEDPQFENRRVRLPGLIGGLKTPSIQYVTMSGVPTGGGYKLKIPWESGAETTTLIPFNGSGTVVAAALEALPSVPIGSVSTASGADWTYDVTFGGDLEGVDVPLMEPVVELTGGEFPWVTVQMRATGYTAPAEDVLVDTDPRVEQIAALNGSQIWARMNGVRFRHPVPPYTKSRTFELTVSGARAGQLITLRLPRAWTRPWGLE